MTHEKSFMGVLALAALPLLVSRVAHAEQVASLEPAQEGKSSNAGQPGPVALTTGTMPGDSSPEPTLAPGLRTLNNTATLFGVLGYGYSGLGSAPGVGARYQMTLIKDVGRYGGKVHDDIGIEGGVDFVHYSWSLPGYPQYSWSYNEVSVLAGVVWNFWIGDKLALYPKVELAYGIGSASTQNGIAAPSYGGLWFQGAAGAAYKLGPIALRAEAGWRALRLGAGYSF
jgi:hypothetical protein